MRYGLLVAATAEMLRSSLGDNRYAVLLAVAGRPKPASGRAIAAQLGLSPTTASSQLKHLEDAGLVHSSATGRSKLWRLNVDSDIIRAWLREGRGDVGGGTIDTGSSPTATGGGGVTLERKVAAQYLGWMLLGSSAVGLGSARSVVSVAFQQAPEFPVDDLLIGAAEDGNAEPSLMMALAVRRAPNVVKSDTKTQALFRTFVQQTLQPPAAYELRLGLAVAGGQDHARQLETLTALAANQPDASRFLELARAPGKFTSAVRERVDHVLELVRLALVDLGWTAPTTETVHDHAWNVMSRLTVMRPRLEAPDDTDWVALTNALLPVARGNDLYGATQLRDRLLALADDYAPVAASVNLTTLRRASHDLLDSTARRHLRGWRALELLEQQACGTVHDVIVARDGRSIRIDRPDVKDRLLRAVESGTAIVVHGDSGVGKSALAARVLSGLSGRTTETEDAQIVRINLRHLPATALEFEASLGAALHDLLADMSAPTRILAVDGADAVAEGRQDILTYLVAAAVAADVKLVAVTAGDAKQVVADTVAGQAGPGPVDVAVTPLTDTQVDEVVAAFAELEPMAANPRSRELLRRTVVVDLLVRSGLQNVPLSDFDAMEQVWNGLIRQGLSGRGTPIGRDMAMRVLARVALLGGDELDALAKIDSEALEGLQRDGLLRTPEENPFRVTPEFAHDEIRRYAIARLLLADGDLSKALRDAAVPRWVLGAARLACQAVLAAPDSPPNPSTGRFGRLQAVFDSLAADGHGERWSDVPGEALLTMGEPRALLREAWPQLRADDGAGLQRLIRLTDQRLRGSNRLVRVTAVEPLIELLLEAEAPWRAGEGEQTLLREWLQALVAADAPAGHPLRERLRDHLVEFCAAAAERLRIEREEQAAKQAELSDEQRTQRSSLPPMLMGEVGFPRSRRRRRRRELAREVTDEVVIELLALLGPDLGHPGEDILQKVADNEPARLHPALEGIFCGRALARWRKGFVAEMTLAYYLDEEDDWSVGYPFDDGIRDHRGFGFGLPFAAWYRGPFMPMLQLDFRGGVSTLNKLLNHAAHARVRSMASDRIQDDSTLNAGLDPYRARLSVTGAPRTYVGDGGVWNWYRGTGVGPYPCMSALQALERVCDQLIEKGVPADVLITFLLDDCENLAMVALVVGVLIRHLQQTDRLLDRFLVEPAIWHLEFGRVVHEYDGLRASSEGIVAPERREWSLRQAAMSLALAAGPARAEELRLVGQQLVENVRRHLDEAGDKVPPQVAEVELAAARAWASGLDRATYTMRQTDEGIVVESHPPDEIATILSTGQSELFRGQESTRLLLRYHIEPEKGTDGPFEADALRQDLNTAASLIDGSTELDAMDWDAPAAVAAVALEQHLVHALPLPTESVKIASEIVLRVAEGEVPERRYEYEESYFSQGADRSAARAIALLLFPAPELLAKMVDGKEGLSARRRVEASAFALSHAVPYETRLHLARGLDRLWESPCDRNTACHHYVGLQIAVETMRECAFGPWDMEEQTRTFERLDDPVEEEILAIADEDIYVARLDAAIRALAPAAVAGICVSGTARELLSVALRTQLRALLAQEDMDTRGTHSLVAARALLTLGEDGPIFAHVDAYLDNSELLDQVLRALSAAAEEDKRCAANARRLWPHLIERVIAAHNAGRRPFNSRFHGRDYALAALLPNIAGESTYLHRELTEKAITWWEPSAWHRVVEHWLDHAAGRPTCVDHLISFLAPLSTIEKARIGLPWVARAVLANPAGVAGRCYLLTNWLVEVRGSAEGFGLAVEWQRVVDALVVAGESQLAPYSE